MNKLEAILSSDRIDRNYNVIIDRQSLFDQPVRNYL